jgi:VWFA-related protein
MPTAGRWRRATTRVAPSLVALVCAGAWVAARPAAPQEAPPQSPPVFRTGVKLVRVDVTVRGRGDRPVDDLQAGDFDIEEDGLPQAVETFQFVRLTGQPRPEDDDALEIRSPEHAEAVAARDDVRLFAIFLDDYHVDFLPVVTLPLRQALAGFVERFGPTDLVAIMDPLTPLSALRFTRARGELLARVKTFEGRQGRLFPVRSLLEEAQASTGQLPRLRAEVTLSALTALVAKLGGMREGRKSVLFVSQGPFLRFRDVSLHDRFREVVDTANRGNVTINVLDPRHLGSTLNGSMDTLRMLADETGGRAIVHTNDPGPALAKVIEDSSAYYLLGYVPSRDPADGRFHRIHVKVSRPGVHVSARRGYWAPKPEEMARAGADASRPEVPGVTGALSELAEPGTGRAIDVWIGFSRGEPGRTVMTVAWDASSRNGTPPVALDVEPLDAGGEPAGSRAGESAPRVTVLDVPAGTSLFRFTARGADGSTVERWQQAIEIEDLGDEPIALATLRLARARNILEYRALAAQDPIVPAASRAFHRTDRVLVEAMCYAAGSEPVDLSVALLEKGGRELAPLGVPALVNGRARFELPLTSLAPGTYILRVRAAAGDNHAERLTAFRLLP